MNIYPSPLLIGLQMIPFMITILSLYFIIFKPMLAYLNDRENASTGATDTAAKLEADIEKIKKEIQSKIDEALQDGSQKRAEERNRLQKEYNEIVQAARKDAEAKIKTATTEIAQHKAATLQELPQQAEEVANSIIVRVLGRNVA